MFKKFNRKMKECVRCELSETRTQVVTSRGSISPYILFVGEAPGYEEDKEGMPFVGKAGKVLDEWIKYLGLTNSDIAITNLIKCRPPNNADPTPNQIKKCSPWLDWQVKFFSPYVIVPIGRIATSYFLGKEYMTGIIDYSGEFYESSINKDIYPIIHPSWFLRQGGKGWEKQLEQLKEHIDLMKRS